LKIVTQDKPSFALNRFFAGFVSVCDWIASSDDVFRSNFSFDLDEHFSVSREKGIVALKKYGLITDYTTIVNRSFVDFFGFSPRGVQRKIEDVLDENQSSFYIVEAPTGEGKSEAAFFTHYKTQNRGLYFALPSQATANQMYGRVISFLEKQMDQKTVTVLAHGFAWLSKEYKSHKQKSKKWDESSGYTSHDEWFFTKKKTLLATSGVGTVDQVMLSVLNTRHYFVKLFALAGKTLIIDEVHAYDYFMLPIIKQLLEWSYFLQINVILLSATLPAVMKKELLQGYTGDDTFCEKIFFESSYPLITTVDRKKNIKQYPVDSTRKKEEIGINLKKHKGDPSSIVNAVMDKIKSGGNVLWICNTVKRAQEVYSILANHKRQECELYLFHSRFTYSDRINKETTVTDLYGKGVDEKPNRNRPLKSILVATQVVEQSLDVDFDFIVTDIAPIDLLLQRFGRMHRHNKNNDNRPERVSQPHACVLVPEVDIEGPIKGKEWSIPNDLKGFAEVYDPLTIYRTIKVLSENRTIKLPEMYRSLVEDVYSESTEFTDFYNTEYDLSIGKTVWENSIQYYNDTKAEMSRESKKYLTVKASKDILKSAALTPTGHEEDSNAKSFIAKTRYGNELNISLIVSHIKGDSIVIGNKTIEHQNDFSDIFDIDLQKIIIENSVKVASPMNFIFKLIKGEINLIAEFQKWKELQAQIKNVPSLRDHYLLILDTNNTLMLNNYIICYESLRGLTITKKEEL
jgi:CRISPR-associated endonuclease/helicase Cas3